ncbi:MAG: hypothetical protein E7090_06185 [Bacteroidales bacterium]|nr:hypothetical protein [Bacteroidales bacterium]
MSLLDSFLAKKGWKKGNEKTHIAPFLPYLIADTLMLNFEENLKGRLRQKEKFHANKMMGAYHRFIHSFFLCFDPEEQTELTDMMDALHEYIIHDLSIFAVQVQNIVIEMQPEERKTFSAVAVCRILSANIKYSWEAMYRRSDSEAIPNSDVQAIYHHGVELFREYSRRTPRYLEKTDLGNYEIIKQAEKALINRILNFIEVYNEKSYKDVS